MSGLRGRRLRIAQVAPLAESVPPKLYGGTERVVSWLTENLVRLGHDVTLFASGDSKTAAKLVSVWPKALRLSHPSPDPMAACAVMLDRLADAACTFDVIHCHLDWMHLPLMGRLGVPLVTTLHGRLDLPYVSQVLRQFPEAWLVSISDNQRKPVRSANWAGTVYHGLPPELLQPSFDAGEYLAFLGRITPEKGPDVAIRLAVASQQPLKIAAKIPRGESRFFSERIEPMLDGERIEFVGEVNDVTKSAFLRKASALLFPIDWPEPFGLVMIEAMACGTPVIAYRRGSVPEIIEDGVTGFIVENEAEALEAIGRLPELDRRQIRRSFEQRFTSERMAKDYLRLYHTMTATRSHAKAATATPTNWPSKISIEGDAVVANKGDIRPQTAGTQVVRSNGSTAVQRPHPSLE